MNVGDVRLDDRDKDYLHESTTKAAAGGIKMRRTLVAGFVLAGISTAHAQSMQRAALISALDTANQYVKLPACSGVNKPPCSYQSIVSKIIVAAELASKAVKFAEILSADDGPADISAETHKLAVGIAVQTAEKIIKDLVNLIPTQQETSFPDFHG